MPSEDSYRMESRADPQPQRPDAPRSLAQRKRRVLVVEDNLDAVHTLCQLLRLSGHEVEFAINGYVAIDIARDFRPEVVLLDIGLPGLSGYEVARVLRQELGSAVRIYAVTAYGSEEDCRKALEAGCELHVRKPVEIAVLESLVQQ